MKPYYEHAGVTIYHGDAREILPLLPRADVIITDPVWPNSSPALVGAERPVELFAELAVHFPAVADRVVIQLGCDSDPRILCGMPKQYKFFRTCWLEYACPTRKGRLLYTGDVAYVYGPPPKSRPGLRVISGRYMSTRSDSHRGHRAAHKEWGRVTPGEHPTQRRMQHVRWLVSRFAEGLVVDPCCGQGTTLRAAKVQGLPSIGIDIEERWCELAAKRLGQEVFDFPKKPCSKKVSSGVNESASTTETV